jgi:hypothetical protein
MRDAALGLGSSVADAWPVARPFRSTLASPARRASREAATY